MKTPSFFGRAWKVTVTPQATGEEWTVSNSSWDTEALKVTFEVEQVALLTYWFADISIYNFLPAAAMVIQKGDLVTLEAGYQSPGSGLIFSGRVFQPVWERSSETDYRLTLHCLVGLFEDETGYVSTSFAAGATQSGSVRQVAAAASPAIPIEYLDPALDKRKLPRGGAYSGRALRFFADIAADNQLQIWLSWKGVTIRSLAPAGETPDVVYAPPLSPASHLETGGGLTKYTLLGTPQQTERGVHFRALLDSDVQLGSLVQLDNVLLSKLRLVPGKLPPLSDGLYVVAGIHHAGDTRGNEWYTEITGVTREYAKLQGAVAR